MRIRHIRYFVASYIAVTIMCLWAVRARAQDTSGGAPAVGSYGNLPLSFEPNRGQTDAAVKFLARGQGYNLYLTPTTAVLQLRRDKEGVALRSRLVGCNPNALLTGLDSLAGKANYFIGAARVTDVPTYGRVVARDVYPGIDLIHYGNAGQLEYDFVVAPGADPSRIRLAIDGADQLTVGDTGELVLSYTGGAVRWHKPVVYQTINGTRQNVAGQFALLDKHTVGFELGAYDHTQPLVIDPILVYSTFIKPTGFAAGDGLQNHGLAITVDADGNAYIAGVTESASFPVTGGVYQSTRAGTKRDVFVAKLNPTGSGLVFATYLGGDGIEIENTQSCGIAIDQNRNVYLTGATISTNFPTTVGAVQPALNYNGISYASDAFVAKLNSTGSALLYSTYLGGTGTDYGWSIAVDTNGNAYVCGDTSNTGNFPTTAGAFLPNSVNLSGWVTKLSTDGTALEYSTYVSSNDCTYARGIAIDTAGNAYVTGNFYDCSGLEGFVTTPGAFQTTHNGSFDAFILKLNPAGSALVYSTFLGGNNIDGGRSIAIDTAGNAYVTGTTSSTDFPTTAGAAQSSFQSTPTPQDDGFVAKISPDGSALVYGTYLGGNATDTPAAIALDSGGNAYVAGTTTSTNFPVSAAAYQDSLAGVGQSAFVTKVNSTGGLLYSTYLHGTNANTVAVAYGIATDAAGSAYVTGTAGLDFPTTPGVFQGNIGFLGGPFVAKLDIGTVGPPTAPIKMRASAISDTEVFLQWKDQSNNENKFKVKYSLTGTSDWITVANVISNVNFTTHTGLTPGITYFYKVRAQNPSGFSSWSNIASATPLASVVAPAAPTDLVATASGGNQVTLSWSDNSTNESGFRIQKRQSLSAPWGMLVMVGANITTYVDKYVSPGTTYYYRVKAYNPTGNSANSNVASADPGNTGGGGGGTFSADIIIGGTNDHWVADTATGEWVQSSGILDIGGNRGSSTSLNAAICTNFPGSTGTYALGDSCGGLFNFDTFTFYGAVSGTLVIQTFDTTAKTASGTFAYTASDGATTITVTNGMFNISNLIVTP